MGLDIIIDGYNLMHAAGLARQNYAQGDLERCRHRLLNFIRHGLSQQERARTTIVFDGQGAPVSGSLESVYHGMFVIFSPSGMEADDVIEELIGQHSAPKQLLIVSSDHRLHKAARPRRALAVDSEEFVQQLQRFARQRQKAPPPALTVEKPVAEDTEEWLQAFGEIDVQQIEASVRAEPPLDQPPVVLQSQQSKPPKQPSAPRKKLPAPTAEPVVAPFESDSDDQALDLEFWEKRIAELDQEGY